MTRNVTLGELIDDLRAEAGHSLQPNLGTAMREVLIKVLQRQQRRLWEDYDWKFLNVRRDILTQAGQRYYNLPPDMAFENIERVEFKDGDRWIHLHYGIGDTEYSEYDSDRDIRATPALRWQEADDGQFEIWPIPSNNGVSETLSGAVRFHGKRNLRPLVAESDRADLDDTLLVLYSAAEILAREKADDAKLKLQMAEKHYLRLKGRTAKRTTFSMSGNDPTMSARRPQPIVISQGQ